jgi:hypothetical protein
VQLGHDVEAIISSAYPSFIFGGRNSAGQCSKLRLLVINLASVPGGQLVNSPTAQSLDRCVPVKKTKQLGIRYIDRLKSIAPKLGNPGCGTPDLLITKNDWISNSSKRSMNEAESDR